MPHVLIAGRTGSGKSVFMQSIITSIVYHASPDEIKLIIVDPKGVDFNKWRDIPHLITPIVTDATSAVNVLKWSVREMEERYKKLQAVDAQNIADYNVLVDKMNRKGKTLKQKVPVGTDEEGNIEYEIEEVQMEKIPYVVIIMDEIADLMQQARKEVEACVQRITQKARAAGIHLVAATQRPDTSVITGIIKSNLPTRISFQARSYIDSMTTLGERGAEMLLAQGDMLYSESGKQPIRIHGAFVSDKEIDKIARFLRSQCVAEYTEGIQEAADEINSAALGLPPTAAETAGDLYRQAIEIVLRDKKPTISYLQRRLGIGYNKAATLIEKMEADGLIVKNPGGKYELA
jgi:S-DNA-T family DNA segregation ATPase FtsK/SpoIIIE